MIKRIGVSTSVFDVDGAKVISINTDSRQSADSGMRRVTRTATLDGNCAIYDTGFAAADSTLNVTSRDSSQTVSDWFAYIVKNYSTVNVSTPRGFFYAVPSKWYLINGLPTLVLLITEQIA